MFEITNFDATILIKLLHYLVMKLVIIIYYIPNFAIKQATDIGLGPRYSA